MELILNDENQLVDAEGKPFEVDGEAVVVKGVKTQADIDKVVESRLARQAEKVSRLENEANALRAQAEKSPELQRMLDEREQELAELRTQADQDRQKAEARVAEQLRKANDRTQELEQLLGAERDGRIRDKVTADILGLAADKFIHPVRDVVPELLRVHKREPARDNDGRELEGQFVDFFELEIVSDGKRQLEALSLEKAVEAFAAAPQNAHYLKPTGRSGSGGGTYSGERPPEPVKGLSYPTME